MRGYFEVGGEQVPSAVLEFITREGSMGRSPHGDRSLLVLYSIVAETWPLLDEFHRHNRVSKVHVCGTMLCPGTYLDQGYSTIPHLIILVLTGDLGRTPS